MTNTKKELGLGREHKMKEIKVAKYSKQWYETRVTIYTIIYPISFCAFVIIMPIMGYCYDEYGLHHVKTIVSIIMVLTAFVAWLYCYAKSIQFEHYEHYIYNRIKKIKRKQDRKYRKWLM